MKKIMILGIVLMTVICSNAQISFGVKGGVNFSSFRGSDKEGTTGKAGFYAGATAELALTKNFRIRPEAVFSMLGAKASEDEETVKLNTNYLTMPVMAVYQLDNGLFAETGPQLGFMTVARLKGPGINEKLKGIYHSAELSWGFGAGYMSKLNIGMNVRYNMGLTKLDKQGKADVYNSVLQVGLMYRFRA